MKYALIKSIRFFAASHIRIIKVRNNNNNNKKRNYDKSKIITNTNTSSLTIYHYFCFRPALYNEINVNYRTNRTRRGAYVITVLTKFR